MRELSSNSHRRFMYAAGPVGSVEFNDLCISTRPRREEPAAMTEQLSRRTLTGLAAAGVGVPLLAACGGDDSDTATDTGTSKAKRTSRKSA